MPLNEKIYDAQIRFVIKSEQKNRLFREAKRRRLAAADLLREFIDDGLDRSEARKAKAAAT